MIEGRDILCFAPDLWSDIWRNRHRLLNVLAQRNRVLYVEPRNSLASIRQRLKLGKLKLSDFFQRRLEEVRPNLFVYHDPLFLPRNAKPLLGNFVSRRRDASLYGVLQRLNFERPLLWLVRPDMYDLLGRFDESAVLYQIVDDYFSFPNDKKNHREVMLQRERQILEKADLVVVTSQTLLEQKRQLHSNVQLIRNAVDSKTVAAGAAEDTVVPDDIRDLPRPILGYIGGVTNKIDLESLEEAAKHFSSGTLVFVGPLRVTTEKDIAVAERLQRLPNVKFLGQKPADEVPGYVRGMDVCLVPYRLGEQAASIDPLKLYEYLAFGKPIVAADIPSVGEFADLIYVARGESGFLRALEEAIAETQKIDADRANARRAAAARNTWEARVDELSGHLEAIFAASSHATV